MSEKICLAAYVQSKMGLAHNKTKKKNKLDLQHSFRQIFYE